LFRDRYNKTLLTYAAAVGDMDSVRFVWQLAAQDNTIAKSQFQQAAVEAMREALANERAARHGPIFISARGGL
jgi:hypothetical protein